MNRRQLERAIKCDPTTRDSTWGVFARSEFPEKPLLPGAYVVNTADSPGEHWILLYVTFNNDVELYDSLGRSERAYGFNFDSKTLQRRLQAPGSTNCALYVLYFLYWRLRNIPMDELFESVEYNGDKIVFDHYASLCVF